MGELRKLRIGGAENNVTPYTAGEGINIDANRQVSVDTDVIATKTDLNNVVPKRATDAEIGSTTQIKNYGDQLKLSYSDNQGWVDVQLEGNDLLVYAEEGNAQNVMNFSANGTAIRKVVTPTESGDAVPKSYVDTRVEGIANAYSASSTYAVGDYVTHNGNVYRCTTAITTAEVWTAAHWTQVTIGDELSQTNEDLSELPKTEDSTKTGVDLDVSDEDGNVLVRFKDGEIQTKEFDSTQASMTKVSDAIADLDFSDTNGNVILRIRDGNIITKRFNSTGKYYEKVISVKKDGTGDYTTLRGALDSITDASVENPYRIEIYPGTYNVMDDYTQEEIETADVSDYHQGFPGPLITNGVSLVGVGCRDSIIIYGTLDTSIYNSTIRGNISTLNIQGNGRIENLTVVCYMLRYCVHDDFAAPDNVNQYNRVVKNCRFDMQRSNSDDSGIIPNSYGAGMSGKGMNTVFENCDFGTALGIHTISAVGAPTHHIIQNCRGYAFRPNDRNETSVKSEFIVNDCNFDLIRYGHYSDDANQVFYIHGTGNGYTMLNCAATDTINIGDKTRHKNNMNLPVLTMVKRSGTTYVKTTDPVLACGIITLISGEYVYIQKGGYINSNILGMSGLAMGDYITVDADGILTTTGATASNAVGVVTNIDEYGVAYMKMLCGQGV